MHKLNFFFFLLVLPVFGMYFEYSEQEINLLKNYKSEYEMNKKDLEKWDKIVSEATTEPISSLNLLRAYTYLYVAQEEAAALSKKVKGCFEGSLDPISISILTLFYPDVRIPPGLKNDPYSNILTKIIIKKFEDRRNFEDRKTSQFEVPKNKESLYVIGLNVAKWIPWNLLKIEDYLPPQPPTMYTSFWKEQIKNLKKEQEPLSDKKKEMIKYWADLSGTGTGDWRLITNQYLFSHPIPFLESLKIRSKLMIGLYDGIIVGFTAKYKYLVMRPSEYDKSVHTEIPVPKHPSYPANHSLLGTIAATILSHYIPNEKNHWLELSDQSGKSRIWAGIHYPYDDEQGREIGKKIGLKIAEASR